MHKLSGTDAAFLYNETERCPQQVSSVQIMELPAGAVEDEFIAELKQFFLRRVHLVPYLTNRLVETPLMADHPVWVRDANFNIDNHIVRVDVAAPGGRAELEAAVAALHEKRLDRSRPLWLTAVLCGLEGGRVAYYSAAHHACLDGMAGQAATQVLMDPTVAPREIEPPPPGFFQAETPTPMQLMASAFENVAQFQIRQAARMLDAIETGVRLQRRAMNPAEGLGAMAERAPRTRFNRAIEGERTYVVAEMELADVKAIGKACEAKLNDVFLAICGGGLRSYLRRAEELPEASLIAGCPVSLRQPGDAAMNNQVTMMQVNLGTDIEDGERRVAAVKESARVAKAVTADVAGVFEGNPAAWGLPGTMQALARVMEAGQAANAMPPAFNVVVSNVPGPRQTLYSNGARMLTHYPVSIPAHGLGVNITVHSYVDRLYVGITACAKALPDAGALRDDIVAEYEALRDSLLPEAEAETPAPAAVALLAQPPVTAVAAA